MVTPPLSDLCFGLLGCDLRVVDSWGSAVAVCDWPVVLLLLVPEPMNC